jgi:hypothetical protein
VEEKLWIECSSWKNQWREKVKQKKMLITDEGDLGWSSKCIVQEEEEHWSIFQMLRVLLQLIIYI